MRNLTLLQSFAYGVDLTNHGQTHHQLVEERIKDPDEEMDIDYLSIFHFILIISYTVNARLLADYTDNIQLDVLDDSRAFLRSKVKFLLLFSFQ
jgi:hypothetical protein